MDLNRVAMFVKIVEAGGVTRAADKLKLPKSSVSRHLGQLEEELGMELLVRGQRELKLSEAGRSFYEAASKGIAAVEEARDGIRDQHQAPSGVVRLAVPFDFGALLVAPLVAQFVRDYPGVEVEMSATTRRVDPIRDGFDLVIWEGKLADSSLIARPLGRGDLGVFAAESYLRMRRPPRTPAELSQHDCVLYRPTSRKAKWVLSRNLQSNAESETVTVSGPMRVDELFMVIGGVAAGAGLALLPVHLHQQYPAMKSLVRVLPDYVMRGEPMQLLYPASRHAPLRVKLLCEAIVKSSSSCPNAGQAANGVGKGEASRNGAGSHLPLP